MHALRRGTREANRIGCREHPHHFQIGDLRIGQTDVQSVVACEFLRHLLQGLATEGDHAVTPRQLTAHFGFIHFLDYRCSTCGEPYFVAPQQAKFLLLFLDLDDAFADQYINLRRGALDGEAGAHRDDLGIAGTDHKRPLWVLGHIEHRFATQQFDAAAPLLEPHAHA
ncbi:hypothetical protein D3C81_675630 [compost metagenome]